MKKQLLLLVLILLGGFIVRMYKFNGPVADWHSWRQADTSSVSRYFVNYGFDLLHPHFHDLSKTPSNGIDNPKGYRFVEFPIYNALQAGGYKIFPKLTLEEWGRLINILGSLISALVLYLLVSKYVSSWAGVFAAFFFAFIPFNIFYSRVILPDPLMVTTVLSSIYFFDRYVTRKENTFNYDFILSLILMIVSILLRPYALFFTIPIMYLSYKAFGENIFKKWQLWIFAFLAVLPFVLWRVWMLKYPEGIPVSNWLFNGNHIRFKGAFFQWIFADRIARLITGYFGLPFIILGILIKQKKDFLFLYTFLFSSLLYLFSVATGNVMHDYYQILIVPTLAIFFGIGVDFILNQSKEIINKYVAHFTVGFSVILMFLLSMYIVRDYYVVGHPEIVIAGNAVDKIAPKDAKVIAAYGGDTTFLYQTKRNGWPVVDRDWKDLIKAGAAYIVIVNPSQDDMNIGKSYQLVEYKEISEINSSYVIFDLSHPLK